MYLSGTLVFVRYRRYYIITILCIVGLGWGGFAVYHNSDHVKWPWWLLRRWVAWDCRFSDIQPFGDLAWRAQYTQLFSVMDPQKHIYYDPRYDDFLAPGGTVVYTYRITDANHGECLIGWIGDKRGSGQLVYTDNTGIERVWGW